MFVNFPVSLFDGGGQLKQAQKIVIELIQIYIDFGKGGIKATKHVRQII